MQELTTMDHVVAAWDQVADRAAAVTEHYGTAAADHQAERDAAAVAAELADDGEA